MKFREEHPMVVLATTGFYYTLMHAFKLLIHQEKKKERKKPANGLNELYNRQGVRKKKKICCGFVRNTTTAQTGIDFLPARARKK